MRVGMGERMGVGMGMGMGWGRGLSDGVEGDELCYQVGVSTRKKDRVFGLGAGSSGFQVMRLGGGEGGRVVVEMAGHTEWSRLLLLVVFVAWVAQLRWFVVGIWAC